MSAAQLPRRMSDPRIRVLLADDHVLFRQVLRIAMEAEAGFDVVAEASDGPTAIGEAKRVAPDVALLDLRLPRCDGLRAATEIIDSVPGCRVILLADAVDEKLAHDALQAGAAGCLSKRSSLDGITTEIRSVNQGDYAIEREVLRPLLQRLLNGWREREEVFRRISKLSPREREVLRLLAAGAGTNLIAKSLYVSPATARTHIQKVITKLGVHSRVEVATYTARHQVIQNLGWML